MRLLIASSLASSGQSWPVLADELIVCGPRELDLELGEQVFSRSTPRGEYDLSAVVAALPPGQRPDVVACVVDSSTRDWPRQVARIPAIRILLVGDSQQSPEGLARLLAYARSEPFDRIVFTHGCLDEAIFIAAGFQQTFWFPGLLCPVRDWLLPILREQPKTRAVGCAAETKARFSARNGLLAALSRRNIFACHWSDDSEIRLEEIAHSQVNLVPSERGEWPDSFFEVLAAGGALVTSFADRAAINRLWPKGAPLIAIDRPDEVAASVQRWLESPEILDEKRIAAADWFDSFLGDRPRREAFAALVLEGRPPVPAAEGAADDLTPHLGAIAAMHLALASADEPVAALGDSATPAMVALVSRYPRLARTVGSATRADLAVGNAAAAAPLRWQSAAEALPADHDLLGSAPAVSGDRSFLEQEMLCTGALVALEAGDYPRAIDLASKEVSKRPASVDAHIVIADLFLEKGSQTGFDKHSGVLKRLAPHDPRYADLTRRGILGTGRSAYRQLGKILATAENLPPHEAAKSLEAHAIKNPSIRSLIVGHADLLVRTGPVEQAIDALGRCTRHHPNDDALWFRLGLSLWKAGRRVEAGKALRRAADHAPHEPQFARALAEARRLDPSVPEISAKPRSLVVSSSENCHRHGVGVLVARYFGADFETITLRSSTCYDGVEEAGGVHLCIPYTGRVPAELRTRIARLLAPYQVVRIMCIPHRSIECDYAIAAQDATSARLCTFVMDDRNILVAAETDDVQMDDLFRRSSLRLVISSEMQMAYTIKYNYDFDVLPPTVSNRAARRVNVWNPKARPSTHVALVGNIWTLGQFLQLVKFMARSNLTVDWYGPIPPYDLTGTGICAKGSVPEQVLADTLVDYPLVLVPSGMLDGTEDNEWLTRLSLPSRLVFLLQAGIPMLVLGSEKTCASRYVLDLGLGRTMSYNHPQPLQVIAEMCKPAARAQYAKNAAQAGDAFVMPDSGQWIWDSLDLGRALPAPFHSHLKVRPEFEVLYPADQAGMIPISHGELAPA